MKSVIKSSILLLATLIVGCSIPESTPTNRIMLSESGVYDAHINEEGSLAIVTAVDGAINVWDLQTNQIRYTWQHQGEGTNLVDAVRFSPDSSVAVTSDSEAFALWNMENGEPIGFWRIDEDTTVRDIAVANNGDAILVGRANGHVLFFEPYSGRRLEFLGHEEKVNTVDLSANGRYAITGGNDYRAYLWDTQTGQIIHVFAHPHRVSMVLMDQQARFVFTADSQDNAQIWDAQTGKAISQLRFIERQIIFTSARFSKDGKWLLTGSPSKRMRLWDVASGEEIKQWRVKANSGPAPQSAVVYAVGFRQNTPMSIASSGYLAYWE
ncbi:WD40 repeat domain-containing protein [Glaciecola sp. 1036]|uniref:WD40 repeat domain-containing protein n=1 Tax=Alteromonadaceae TaxID=72275 RepID=UPI003D07A986